MTATQTADRARNTQRLGKSVDQVSSWSRDIRFVSGMILLAFVSGHFLNHALGIAGVAVMETVQDWRLWLWRSWPGTIALYGSFLVHPTFAMLRVAQRRTFRMPAREMLQIALGLAIPLFLIDHVVGTRVVGTYFQVDESYHAVLRRLWPSLATSQSILLLIVWVHGIIGLHFSLRSHDGYLRWRDPFMLAAILIPVLALIGFAVAGREAGLMALPEENNPAAMSAMFAFNVFWAKTVFFSLVGSFVLFVAVREIRVRTTRQITVRFMGHGVRKLVPGLTVLEMFRRFGIPHAALCGGRARCATCRVLVIDGGAELAAPGANEAKLLRRIGAPERVRLACQIRPRADLQVQILLASKLGKAETGTFEPDATIGKRTLTILVADLRAFSALSQQQLPHELMALLNRFFDEMAQAMLAHGGRIDAFYGDGFMAVFGVEGTPSRGAHAAITAAGDIVRAVEALNREYGAALPLPLRIGIGIHSGDAIIGSVENESLGRRDITIGETVMIASQLESATRRVLSDIVVSRDTIRLSRRRYRGTKTLKVFIKGRDEAMKAYGFASAPELAASDDAVDHEITGEPAEAEAEAVAEVAGPTDASEVAAVTEVPPEDLTEPSSEASPAKGRKRAGTKTAAAKTVDVADDEGADGQSKPNEDNGGGPRVHAEPSAAGKPQAAVKPAAKPDADTP